MIRRRAALAALTALACGAAASGRAAGAPGGAQAFEFVALGDMPYGPDLIAGPAYRHLIELVNQAAPAFSIHVGDFKDGTAACSDAEYGLQGQNFQRFAGALVYTPGDNDWIDCQRRGDDPLERLQALRERFFAAPRSLGQRPIVVLRQADAMPAFARYRENQRWVHQGVVFATFHTVGPRNGLDSQTRPVRAEAHDREAANAAWIADAFALVRRSGARALVLATQAESLVYPDPLRPHRGEVDPAFASIRDTLLPLAAQAPFPMLLIHGDHHRYTVDRPFRDGRGRRIARLQRLQVFGDPRLHAVRVAVSAGDLAGGGAAGAGGEPFGFTPIFNPMSTDPQLRPRRDR